MPVAADYNGDGKADVAVYRKTTGQWFIDYSSGGLQGVAFGNPNTDIPVPADYDGDGKADLALFRPVNPATPGQGNWLILGSSTPGRIVAAGAANDVPLLAPMQPYRVQSASVVTRAVLGGPADAPVAPAANLGGTALSFAASLAPAKAAQSVTPPPAFAGRPPPPGAGRSPQGDGPPRRRQRPRPRRGPGEARPLQGQAAPRHLTRGRKPETPNGPAARSRTPRRRAARVSIAATFGDRMSLMSPKVGRSGCGNRKGHRSRDESNDR